VSQFAEAFRREFPFAQDDVREAKEVSLVCPNCTCANTATSRKITLHRDGTAHCHQCEEKFPVKDT
jgi:hypothetical protein